MGIKYFFTTFKKKYPQAVYEVKNDQKLDEINQGNITFDNLCIDMNGLFHEATQKIFKYGNYEEKTSFLRPREKLDIKEKCNEAYKYTGQLVDEIFKFGKPTKRLILCVDGVAPLCKQRQQRQRRYFSTLTKNHSFDSCAITPGTVFMDTMGKYLDYYIRMKIETDPEWAKIEVVYSNHNVPGEGEHKILHILRQYDKYEKNCVVAMDADLIMLGLGTHNPNFYILRPENRTPGLIYNILDFQQIRNLLEVDMKWEGNFKVEQAFDDFIFVFFIVGNDFLPSMPGIELLNNGMDLILDIYKNTCKVFGHMTKYVNGEIRFRRKPLIQFLSTLSEYEESSFVAKIQNKNFKPYFTDELLEKHTKYVQTQNGLEVCFDIDKYREEYHFHYFSTDSNNLVNSKQVCHSYLEGMQWVLSYYIHGVKDWDWAYPYYYAPFCYELAKHVKSFKHLTYKPTTPTEPFVQLLSVLPPDSAHLLPKPLNTILPSLYPEEIKIDVSGKRNHWEATVLLPLVDKTKIEHILSTHIHEIDSRHLKRNKRGKTFIYNRTIDGTYFNYESFYGSFKSHVFVKIIDF